MWCGADLMLRRCAIACARSHSQATDALSACKRLEVLDLSSNRLEAVPEAILACPALIELRLSMNPLQQPLPSLAPLRTLMHLGLVKCGLTEIPSDLVTNLPRLATLDVARNQLTSLPPPSPKSDITRLYAAHNQLPSLDEAYLSLPLVELDLSHNRLTCWPDALGSGGILERIILSHNQIAALPAAASKVRRQEPRAPNVAAEVGARARALRRVEGGGRAVRGAVFLRVPARARERYTPPAYRPSAARVPPVCRRGHRSGGPATRL